MKKFFLALVVLMTISSPTYAHTGQADFATKVSPIVVDGILDEQAWMNSYGIEVSAENLILGEVPDEKDLSAHASFGWDDEYFYIALQVRDERLVTDRIPFELHKQDSVQFLLDFAHQGRGYEVFNFAVDTRNGLGPWFSIPGSLIGVSYHTAGSVTRFAEVGYSAEIAIPLTRLEKFAGSPIEPGMTIGMNVVVNDSDTTGEGIGWETAFVWSGSQSGWSEAHGFGDLVIVQPEE